MGKNEKMSVTTSLSKREKQMFVNQTINSSRHLWITTFIVRPNPIFKISFRVLEPTLLNVFCLKKTKLVLSSKLVHNFKLGHN